MELQSFQYQGVYRGGGSVALQEEGELGQGEVAVFGSAEAESVLGEGDEVVIPIIQGSGN